jgi:hypothetical protein
VNYLKPIITSAVLLVSCSSGKTSERDSRREQLRIEAEAKRQEFNQIIGLFSGTLASNDYSDKTVSLKLTIKDTPQNVEDKVDPVLTPSLSGYLRFVYGDQAFEKAEFVNFTLAKADFDAKLQELDLVLENSEHKSINLHLRRRDKKLVGNWVASETSEAGSAEFELVSDENKDALYLPALLSGDYSGHMTRLGLNQSNAMANLSLSTSPSPPDILKIIGSLKIFISPASQSEYVVYTFEEISFNPITGLFSMKNSTPAGFVVSGQLSDGSFTGKWISTNFAQGGEVALSKGSTNNPGASQ